MMVLTKEQENFVKLAQVLVDVLRKHLRKRFIKQWNEKFHATPWNSDSFSGEYLWREIPNEIQNDKKLFPHDVQNKILSGKEDSFGATLLIILLLHAKLNLIETCRRDRKLPLRLSERLDNIRAIRNTFFGNAPNSELSNAEYITVSTELKYEVLHAFGVDAVEEIDVILASEFETQLPVILLDRLNLEIQRNRLLEEKLEAIDEIREGRLFDLSSQEDAPPDRSTSIYKLVETYVLVEPSSSRQRQRQHEPQDTLLLNKDEMRERLSIEESSNAVFATASSGEIAVDIEVTGNTITVKSHPKTFEALEMESELSADDSNFVKIAKILLDIIPKYLRVLFKEKWNNKYANQQWESDSSSRSLLLSKLPNEVNNNTSNEAYLHQIKAGDEQSWDTNTLLFVLLKSTLSLIPKCRPTTERISPLLISEEISKITNVRDIFFHSLPFGTCPADDFAKIIVEIKLVAKNVFGEVAEEEIDKVVRSDILSRTIQLNEQEQMDDVHQKQQLSREEENFLKIGKIVVSIIPKYLLICLKGLWNEKHPQEKWQGNGRSGERLLKELQSVEHGALGGSIVHRLKAGNEHEWDGTTLLHVLHNSGLLSADGYPAEEQKNIAILVSQELDKIKEVNQMFYGLVPCMSCQSIMFSSIIEKIKSVAKNIFGEEGENEINEIANARIKWKIISAKTTTQ